jgi:hypothetical protein
MVMKKVMFFTAMLVVLTCVSVLASDVFLVDNCEGGKNVNVNGGYWFTYNDANAGGNSVVTPEPDKFVMSSPGAGSSKYAAQLKGTVGNKLGWDFVGMGVLFNANSGCPESVPMDMTKYKSLVFKVKGNVTGGRLTVILPYVENTCEKGAVAAKSLTEWADYESGITSKITKDWTTVKLDLRKDFKQARWAKKTVSIEDVLKNLHNVDWHFSSPDGDSIDIMVDDIQFE